MPKLQLKRQSNKENIPQALKRKKTPLGSSSLRSPKLLFSEEIVDLTTSDNESTSLMKRRRRKLSSSRSSRFFSCKDSITVSSDDESNDSTHFEEILKLVQKPRARRSDSDRSAEKFLQSLEARENKQTKASKIHKERVPSKSERVDGSFLRSESFDSTLKFLLTPPSDCSPVTSSQSSSADKSDLSFEEIINILLTPDASPLIKSKVVQKPQPKVQPPVVRKYEIGGSTKMVTGAVSKYGKDGEAKYKGEFTKLKPMNNLNSSNVSMLDDPGNVGPTSQLQRHILVERKSTSSTSKFLSVNKNNRSANSKKNTPKISLSPAMEVQQKKTNNPRSNLASKYHSDEEARFKLALTRALYPNLKEREKNGSDLINASELNDHNNVSQHLQLPPKKNSQNLVSSQKVHSVPRTRMNRNNETLASRNQLQKNIPPRPLISNCLKSKESINIDTVENIVDQFFSVPENNISLETQASNCSQTTRFKEMSTQTSFNESFISVSTLRNVVPPSRQIGSISSAQSSQNGDLNSDFSLVCQDNTMRHCFAKNTPKMSLERQLLAKRRHILDVLSQDVTLLPDGRKMYNNISKIGTDEWLRFALYYVSNEAIINKREKMVDIVETGNTFDMYVDYRTQIQLKRYNDKETKVYKLTKIRALNCGIFKNDDTAGSTEIITTEASKSQLQLSINEICKNQSLRCDDYDPRELDKSKIRIKIHSIFAKMYEVFENNQIPNILYGRQHNFKDCVFENERLKRGQFSKKINMKYKNSRSLFCRIVYVLGKIYVLLQTNKKLTKRELFYQIKHIIVRQSLVDRAIDEVSRLLGLGPWNLNIVTHSGLVYGNLQLVWASGEKTNCNLPATLIPYDLDNLVEVRSTAAFILVVEKESIFHKLLEEDLPNKLARPFIMITGKGVPDNTTRLFLNRISRIMAVPVFIIADADVYGIKIMLTYRFGSFANCHLSDDLAVPHARWMGVFPNEIKKYAMKNQPITKRDKNQIQSVLKYPYLKQYPKIVAELEFLLSCNMKASIEGLLKSNTFLSESYLPMKFLNQDFI